MANSRKPRPSSPLAEAARALAAINPAGKTLTAGLSGGLDSVVLLHVLLALRKRLAFSVSAVHVNHGLSPNASRWEAFCRGLCSTLRVPLAVERVNVARKRAGGLEAAARGSRYRAFAAHAGDAVVLAHHQDDQVETLLLQLLRGAGVRGLAAMPAASGTPTAPAISAEDPQRTPRLPVPVLRPLLALPRSALLAYARRHKLKWVQDESNDLVVQKRNFLRHEVLPEIERAFPAYRTTIARSASHCAEAATLLDEIGAADVGKINARARSGGRVNCARLRRLAPARAANALRVFLARHGLIPPGTDRLREMLRQLMAARGDAQIRIEHDGVELRRFRDAIWVVAVRSASTSRAMLAWNGETKLEFGAGVLEFKTRGIGNGLSLARLRAAPVSVRSRKGGESLRPDAARPRRSLKNLMQESAVPPWERGQLPLLYSGTSLAWVPGVGTDCAFSANPGEAALFVTWRPHAGAAPRRARAQR